MNAGQMGCSVGSLGQLSFGCDDAESDIRGEKGGLLSAGFVRTAAFEAVLAGRKHLVIGRKGSGKSAICRELAAARIGGVVVSLVTPGGVSPEEFHRPELQGVAAGVSAQLLWRYVLVVQVARHVVAQAAQVRGRQVPHSVEALRKFLADNGEDADLRAHRPLSAYFGRLRSVSLGAFGATVGVAISEPAQDLRPSDQVEVIEWAVLAAFEDLGPSPGLARLLVLADELEQLWSGDAWSGTLVSALLLAARHVTLIFPRVECVVFVRTDIYDTLRFGQKDRLRGEEVRISWTVDGLRDLLLARARASAGQHLAPDDLWGGMFPAAIDGRPTADYLISRTLGRPRDLIQLASNAGKPPWTGAILRSPPPTSAEAEAEFSAWKLQDLEAEYEVSYPFLPTILALFQDFTYIVARQRLENMLSCCLPALREQFPGHAPILSTPGIIGVLYEIGFLGVRREQRVLYSHHDVARPRPDERAFYIHSCFRPALGASRSSSVHESQLWTLGLWGAPSSGKTTFLAALNIAAARSNAKPMIYGINDESTDFLADSTHMLDVERRFPAGTMVSSSYSYTLNIPALRAGVGLPAPAMPTQFNIDLRDAPGGYFGPRQPVLPVEPRLNLRGEDPSSAHSPRSDLIEYLSGCNGFILLIDPVRQKHLGDAYEYFGAVLLEIAQKCHAQMRTGDGWLPH